MTDYVKAYVEGGMFAREARNLAERMPTDSTITNGVMRWNSNNQVPPTDCVALAKHIGMPVDVAACEQARDAETKAFLDDYRKRQRGRKPSAEEQFNLRAAFGPGATVVNVITGRRHRT